jgi:hypothetical protein
MNSMQKRSRSSRPLSSARQRNQHRLQRRRQLLRQQRQREQNLLLKEPNQLLLPVILSLEETP